MFARLFHRSSQKLIIAMLCLFAVLFLVSCQSQAAEPTVIFKGDECSYSGPKQIKAGTINFTLDVQEKKYDDYAGLIAHLYEDKTIADLEAWTSTDKPSWLEIVTMKVTSEAGKLTFPVAVKRGPVYIVCFSDPPEQKIGQIGPIEVLE